MDCIHSILQRQYNGIEGRPGRVFTGDVRQHPKYFVDYSMARANRTILSAKRLWNILNSPERLSHFIGTFWPRYWPSFRRPRDCGKAHHELLRFSSRGKVYKCKTFTNPMFIVRTRSYESGLLLDENSVRDDEECAIIGETALPSDIPCKPRHGLSFLFLFSLFLD